MCWKLGASSDILVFFLLLPFFISFGDYGGNLTQNGESPDVEFVDCQDLRVTPDDEGEVPDCSNPVGNPDGEFLITKIRYGQKLFI